jgi:hypothetical protein
MILPSSNDRVIIRRFDLDKALAKTGGDWLVVASNPPTGFVRGQPYTYAIDVRASHKPLRFALETAPAGMTISADGKISWQPAANLSSDRVPVVVSITDSTSKLRRHCFAIERRPDAEPSIPADAATAAKLAQDAVCQGNFTLARKLATTAGGDLPEMVELAARPMETLDEAEALKLGEWYKAVAAKAAGDLKITATRHAGRYLNLYLALYGETDPARDAVKLALDKLKPTGSSDLLDYFKQSMWLIEGKSAATDEGVHIITDKDHPRLVTYLHCRGSYHLHCEFTPKKAKEIAVTFPVGEGSAVLNLGGWDGVAALCDLHALPNGRFEHKPWKVENGHPYKLDVYVILNYADARIAVDLDGGRLLDWSGAQKEIKVQLPTWTLPYYDGICFCGGDTLFTAATLTPLDGGINTRSIATARDFNDTFLSEMPLPAGGTATGQNLTFTPTGPAGITSAYSIADNFDRFEGAVHLPPTGTGGCAISCDGVVKWRTSATQRNTDQPFLLDVQNVKRIELTTTGEPATWIAPRLRQTDEEPTMTNTPLWASAKNAGDHHTSVPSKNSGGNGGNAFEEIFPNGGILVGLRTSYMPRENDWCVRSIQAVYETPDGEYHSGITHGSPGREWAEDIAPAGYAVGQIEVVSGELLDGLCMKFMHIGPNSLEDDGIDNFNTYRGKQMNQNTAVLLGNKGRPIIGLRGRAGDGIDAIGVINAP